MDDVLIGLARGSIGTVGRRSHVRDAVARTNIGGV